MYLLRALHGQRFGGLGVRQARLLRERATAVSAFHSARFTFFHARCSSGRRFTGLDLAWDSIRFGGRPAVLFGAGDSTATVCPSMGMERGMKIMPPRRCTSILCTYIAEKDVS